jgi:hypothetical protein
MLGSNVLWRAEGNGEKSHINNNKTTCLGPAFHAWFLKCFVFISSQISRLRKTILMLKNSLCNHMTLNTHDMAQCLDTSWHNKMEKQRILVTQQDIKVIPCRHPMAPYHIMMTQTSVPRYGHCMAQQDIRQPSTAIEWQTSDIRWNITCLMAYRHLLEE